VKSLAPVGSRIPLQLGLLALLAVSPGRAEAFPGILNAWQERYGAVSPSGDTAGCQLCHANANGGSPWNAYGWALTEARDDLACDLDGSGAVSNPEAFFCVEMLNSDLDGSGYSDITEIGLGTQPGWTQGAFNTLYDFAGTIPNQLPPSNIGPLDPDGTEPPPPPPPPPPGEEGGDIPPDQITKKWILVKPGQSIQKAIDLAQPGMAVYVEPGVYRELADKTNGVNITKIGIRLIGRKGKKGERVVLENAGNQRNGIVIVPEDRTDCMSCHTDLAPPFPLQPWVETGLSMRDPMMHDVEVRGITIRDFRNNGLFAENLYGYKIIDVESIDNPNYGIFPTLSKNGLIRDSYVTGADDSGIWVETSENVKVVHNVVENNVNGFELSNSENVQFVHNVARNNSVGFAILLLPDIFDDRPGSSRIEVRDNDILDNNKPNTATPGSVLSYVPPGIGILHVGVDDSKLVSNRIEGNDFGGIAIVDYCLVVSGTPFNCGPNGDPSVTPEFVADQSADDNRIVHNMLADNGTNPSGPFAGYAGDLSLLTFGDHGNCFENNTFSTFFSLIHFLPACP
jgi:parallel beta-helix repeat protein